MMRLPLHSTALLFALVLSTSLAVAQSASFTVLQHGQQVGTASFRFTPSANGIDSTSLVRVSMTSLDYALSKSEHLTAAHHLRSVQLSGTVNGSAVTVNGSHDPSQFTLQISANGRNQSTHLPFHPAAVFLPDFDPGPWQTLLALAASGNGHDLWVILPKQAGSITPVILATLADEQGTLDGKPIAVHHLTATIASAKTELFTGPQNQLLQAELSLPGFALVRTGFVLAPPNKPTAVPAE